MIARARAVLIASAVVCALVGAVVLPAPAEAMPRDGAVLAGPGMASAADGALLTSPARVVEALRDRRVSDASLRDVSPLSLLTALPELDAAELRGLATGTPATVRELVRHPPSTTSVIAWWASLDPAARGRLEEGVPEIVGNLEGVPFRTRDAANRGALAARTAALQESLASLPGRGAQQVVGRDLTMLDRIRSAATAPAGEPPRALLTLDTVYPGRAAVVIGDLDTAAYVDILVPGMYFSITDRMLDWTAISERVHDQQTVLLARSSTAPGPAPGVATIAWIGYRTPDLMDVGTLDLAHEGADYLEDAVLGIQGVRRDDPPYVAVLAHSYGSTAALLALSGGRVQVDALALVGSPGGGVRDAAQLNVPAGRVFVGEAAWDPVVSSSFFGTDPGSPGFGARLLGLSGGIDPITGHALAAPWGHNGYFAPGTESLRSLALIGIDRSDRMPASAAGGPVHTSR